MSDYLVKSLAFDGQIRAYAVDAQKRSAQLKNCMILGVRLRQPLDGVW